MLVVMIPSMLFLGVLIFGISMIFTKKYKKYASAFKRVVIKELIKNFYDNSEYYPEKQFPKRIYDEGEYEYYDRYYSDDYIEAKINNEYFPSRTYEDLTLNEGWYDALIISLGTGEGDNWWCVVYPPLCFTSGSCDIKYKSKILEIIRNFKN